MGLGVGERSGFGLTAKEGGPRRGEEARWRCSTMLKEKRRGVGGGEEQAVIQGSLWACLRCKVRKVQHSCTLASMRKHGYVATAPLGACSSTPSHPAPASHPPLHSHGSQRVL